MQRRPCGTDTASFPTACSIEQLTMSLPASRPASKRCGKYCNHVD